MNDAIAVGNIFGDPVRAPKRAVQYMEMGFTGVKYDPVMPMSAFDPQAAIARSAQQRGRGDEEHPRGRWRQCRSAHRQRTAR